MPRRLLKKKEEKGGHPSRVYLETRDFKVDEDAVQLLLLFDLGPVVLLARPEVLAGRQPQSEVDPALDRGALRPSAQLVPALDARRRYLLLAQLTQ